MTQLECARNNIVTPEIKAIAEKESITCETLMEHVAKGFVVIPKNIHHNIKNICGIGKGLKTKINANIGASDDSANMHEEMEKLKIAVEAGADTVMDLSIGSKIDDMLKSILKESDIPVGTVPIYEIAAKAQIRGSITDMRWEDMEEVLEAQAALGVDFFTIHAGVTRDIVTFLKRRERILDVVSRGGSLLVDWIITNNAENPFYTNFDRVLQIAKKYDVTLSLGDGMRPGAIEDAGDEAQVQELIVLGRLAKKQEITGYR